MIPLGALADAFRHEPHVQLAVLFGSEAVGRARPSSDLDIGVLGDEDIVLPRLAVALSRLTGRRVELVSLRDAPPLLRFEIARDGHVHRATVSGVGGRPAARTGAAWFVLMSPASAWRAPRRG